MNMPRSKFLGLRFVLPALALFGLMNSAHAAQGLLGEYFSEQRFENAAAVTTASRVDTTLNLDFTIATNPTLLPAGVGDVNNISIRHTGDVVATVDGSYIFSTSSDDGSRVFVNGKLLVRNSWTSKGEAKVAGTPITLKAGQRYAIRQEFFQGTGGAVDRLYWTPPAAAEAIIPASNLIAADTTPQGGGLLAANPAPINIPTPINLTADGDIDWIHWGVGDATGRNRKQTGGEFIADYAQQGPDQEAVMVGVGASTFTWTDGATTGDVAKAVATQGGTSALISQGNVQGDGFEVVAPADLTPRRLRVYLRSTGAPLTVEAKLSDFSAMPISLTLGANSEQVFTFVYRAKRANQMIVVRAVANSAAGPGQIYAATVGNPAPTATPQSGIVLNEDQINFPITLTGTDPENQTLTYLVTVPPTNGTLSGTAPMLFYTPNANYSGPDSFSFTVTDPTGLTSSATVTLSVTPQPDGPPALVNDTATTPDNVPVTVNVLANDTIIDRPFTVSIVGQPANGTAILNPDNTITYRGKLSFAGTDVVTYRVTDTVFGQTATATLTITVTAIPPVITSPLAVNGIQGLLFTYKITATGTIPMTFTAAPLPAGLTLVGDTIQGFISPGSYAVTISATNAITSDIRILVINAIAQSPNTDTDGDGYTDEFEIGVGSSPVDPASTPFSVLRNGAGSLPPGVIPPGPTAIGKPFFISSLAIKLDFKSTKVIRDGIALRGTLPVPATFSSAIQPVAISVGGPTFVGVLDTRGSYTSPDKRIKIKVGKTRTSLAGGNAPISITAKGIFAGALTDEGYVNATVSKILGKVILYITAGTEYFTATANTEYSARVGQKGTVKFLKR